MDSELYNALQTIVDNQHTLARAWFKADNQPNLQMLQPNKNEERADSLQARADYNRDNAALLYSDKLIYGTKGNRWYTRDGMHPVIFTPYGWVVDK